MSRALAFVFLLAYAGVAEAALSINTTSLPDGVVGVAYGQTLAATGGPAPFTWTVSAGQLPSGLSLSSGGAITGTPSAADTGSFTVKVTDGNNGTATQALQIVVEAAVAITTSSLPAGSVGTAYAETLAASGGSAVYTWSVSAGSLPGGLALSTAGVISGTPTTAVTASFTVKASSAGSSATKALSIAITGVKITTSSLPEGVVGTAYEQTLAATGGTVYSWSLTAGTLPVGLTLNSAGTIAGTPSAAGTSNFTVQVTDKSGSKATAPLSIVVAAANLVVTTSSLPAGIAGVAYSQSLSATGGSGAETWSIATGALPGGLSLSAAGLIAGTPAAAGTASFTVQVADSDGSKGSAALSITIGPALSITTTQINAGSTGSAYSQTFSAAGGQAPYKWQLSGNLPNGLSFAATGVLSGTPTAVGTFPLTVKVTDNTGAAVSANYSLQIASGLAIVTPPGLPTGEIGVAYAFTLQASGGAPTYEWTVTAGSLPSGLNFSSDGQISGTPAASGTFQFTAQATDTSSNHATKQFTLTVIGGLTITALALPGGSVAAVYAQTFTAVGGQPPYIWSVTGGALPNGLSLGATSGILSGTPSAAGSFSFTVTVTDSNSATAQRAFSVTIGAGLTVTSAATLPSATVGTAYSVTLQAAGGQTPYTWSVTQGSLPSGLALAASSGQISGTPMASGTSNFTVAVNDAAGSTATAAETIVVGVPGLPTVSIGGFSGTLQPLQQPSVNLSLAAPFPVALTGTLSLTFTPGGSNPADDPSIQFSTGGRTAAFTIAAGSTQATFGSGTLAVQTGSVQGTIALAITALQAGGTALAIPPGSSQSVTIGAAPPTISSLTVTTMSGGFNLTITGVADTRDLTSATITFQPVAGTTLQTSTLTVPLTAAANGWFQGSGSAAYGGQFNLTLPFTFSGSVSLSSVSAVLASSAGNSASASVNY